MEIKEGQTRVGVQDIWRWATQEKDPLIGCQFPPHWRSTTPGNVVRLLPFPGMVGSAQFWITLICNPDGSIVEPLMPFLMTTQAGDATEEQVFGVAEGYAAQNRDLRALRKRTKERIDRLMEKEQKTKKQHIM